MIQTSFKSNRNTENKQERNCVWSEYWNMFNNWRNTMEFGVTKVLEVKLNKKLSEPAVWSQKTNMLNIPAP